MKEYIFVKQSYRKTYSIHTYLNVESFRNVKCDSKMTKIQIRQNSSCFNEKSMQVRITTSCELEMRAF